MTHLSRTALEISSLALVMWMALFLYDPSQPPSKEDTEFIVGFCALLVAGARRVWSVFHRQTRAA
jgi:hypothetical protein